ncbi:MAG: hypothetical protein HFE77_01740 [Clostridiales bacterium]|nr:hypothetical protein [Clostridiales bacterium]
MPGQRLNIDWEKLKCEYALGTMSTNDMAEKYGCSHSTILKHCQSDHWKAARKAYKDKMVKSAIHEAAEAAGDKLFSLMQASDKLDDMIGHICLLLDNEELTVRDIKDLASAIKDAITIKRDLWNLPKEKAKEAEIVVRFDGPEEYAT